jgi:hypothetical protein
LGECPDRYVSVAETSAEGAKLTRPTSDQPACYVAFDDDYWETGDPVANEKPPTAAAVARELHTPLRDDLTIRERELLELAQDGRYFVIVSAYDYAALGRHETRLLWRTKMSANDPGVAMVAALPALIQGGGPYFGRDNEESQFVRTPLEPGDKVETGSPARLQGPDLTGAARQLDDPFVREIAEKEGVEVTGARSRRASS